jgi:hypothetical protein
VFFDVLLGSQFFRTIKAFWHGTCIFREVLARPFGRVGTVG